VTFAYLGQMRFPSPFLFSTVFAAYAVFESQTAPPPGWTLLDKPPNPWSPITLRFYLKTDDAALQRTLLEVSDPRNPRYGNHLSRQELQNLVAPEKDALVEVKRFMMRNGFKASDYETSGDQVKLRIPLTRAERILHTRYQQFQNEQDGSVVIRAANYSLPEEMHRFVAMVQPTTMFGLRAMGRKPIRIEKFEEPAARKKLDTKGMGATDDLRSPYETEAGTIGPIELDDSACNATTALKCLTALYGFGNYTPNGLGSLGVTGFLDQYAQFDDQTSFLAKYRPEVAAEANFSVVSVNGGRNLQDAEFAQVMEANLDVQYAGASTWPVPMTYFTVGGSPPYVPDLVGSR
jgi:tripeptidyl-peptidase-1